MKINELETMILDGWARRWGISESAMTDLKKMLGLARQEVLTPAVSKEGDIQNLIRLEASQKGARLWRNNVGATYAYDGSFIRYGLANDSTALNKQIKSADLIGIKPILIEPKHVGLVIGQFLSREVKKKNWRYSGSEHEEAQLRWAELILSLGGDACFATSDGTI